MTSSRPQSSMIRVLALIVPFFLVSCGGSKVADADEPPPPRKPKPVEKIAPKVVMTPRILFGRFVVALASNDRVSVEKCSMLDPKTLDLLITEERASILSKGGAMTLQFNMTKETVATDKATLAAVFRNTNGLDIMELEVDMELKAPAEDWQVVTVKDRWYGASGHPAETKTVKIGDDRSSALRKEVSNVAKIPEAEPAPVDWLPNTSDETKLIFRAKLKLILDRSKPADSTRAIQDLAEFGKQMVPGLLNELVAVDFRSEEGVRIGFDLDRTLNLITGLEMGYDVANMSKTLPPAQARQRAVRRWFGWWEGNKDKPITK